MAIILSDHNCEGHAEAIFHALRRLGYISLLALELRYFVDVGLSRKATDEQVWQLCQERDYFLLTGNRRTVDEDQSLEFVIRRNLTPSILPVLTVGNLPRIFHDSHYCQQCAERLAEIVFDPDLYRGVTRLYLPGPSNPS